MRGLRASAVVAAVLCLLALAAGCGQMGPLTLPAPEPAGESDDDEES